MQKRSVVILAVCVLIGAGLFAAFILSQKPSGRLTEQDAVAMVERMEQAFRNKNANDVMAFVAPGSDTKVAGATPDQFRLLLVRYFRNSDHVSADMKNYQFAPGDAEATLQFDIVVHNDASDSHRENYGGHVTVRLRNTEIPQVMGLFRTKEWRVTGVESTGPDLSTFGD